MVALASARLKKKNHSVFLFQLDVVKIAKKKKLLLAFLVLSMA